MRNLFLFAGFALFFTVCLTSCGNEDPAEGVDVSKAFPTTATVEGFVYLNVNANTSPTDFRQFVPEGTLLSFTIAYGELGIEDASGNYVVTAEVGSDGRYSVEVPTKNDGTAVWVTINGNPFVLDVKNGYRTETRLFTVAQNSQSVIKGFSYHKDLTYTGEILSETEAWVPGTFKARLIYRNDLQNSSQTAPIPSGTEVTVTINRNQFVPARENDLVVIGQVGSDGNFSITLPAPTVQMRSSGLTTHLRSDVILLVRDGDNSRRFRFSLSTTKSIFGGVEIDEGNIELSRHEQI